MTSTLALCPTVDVRGLAGTQVWGHLGLVETNPGPQRRFLAEPQNQTAAFPQPTHGSICCSLSHPIPCLGSFVSPSSIWFMFLEHLFHTCLLPSQVHSDTKVTSRLFVSPNPPKKELFGPSEEPRLFNPHSFPSLVASVWGCRHHGSRLRQRTASIQDLGWGMGSSEQDLGVRAGESVLRAGRPPYGEGSGNPLQYSCLRNLLDRGAWWATA